MANLHDLLRSAVRPNENAQFELDLDGSHLRSRTPQELRPLEGSFRFVPVDFDPFLTPEERAAKAKAGKK